jgi:intracellular multiplication protein IcmG
MTNNTRQTLGDEEYHFPSDEYVSTESTTVLEENDHFAEDTVQETPHEMPNDNAATTETSITSGLPAVFAKLWDQHKRALIVVGAAVIALIIFKVLHHSKATVVQPAPAITQAMPVAAPQPAPQQAMNVATMQQLSQLSQTEEGSQQMMSQLQAQVTALKNSLSVANSTQAQMNQTINSLSYQIKDLADQVKQLQAKGIKKTVVPPVVFHIQAIVPGRAWLVGSDGSTETVSAGDKVTGYGKVLAVNEDQGIVLTSSGRTIVYGVNDQ